VTALLEFEDQRFYQHIGIDVYALVRAVWQNLTAGRIVSGASTITMQVARLLSGLSHKTWRYLSHNIC
jgi:penicillin-binding protein 1C